ncbi:MAG: hypothetical protein Q7T44_07050 [Parvibaculum sp.]|nr:hypothetical protein [Parvibaculum sp.]
MHGKLSSVMSALVVLVICVAFSPAAKAAQEINPLFVQAQQYAAQVASSSASDDVKAGFAQRFATLQGRQQQLWQLAGEVDAGQCIGGCLDNYNNEIMSWQSSLQQFSADAAALAPQGDAQASLQNNTSGALDFYIDGQYQCHTLMNLFCTAQTKSGPHVLTATSGSTVVKTEDVILTAGESRTWTVP